MSVVAYGPAPVDSSASIVPASGRSSRRDARIERRRLRQHDRTAARLAELHGIRALLTGAGDVVSAGWVQHGWFTVVDEHGVTRRLGAAAVHLADAQPVLGACLVGAVVHAGGGPSAVRSQLVQRTFDLTWHTLHADPRQPVRWCPSPATRTAQVQDLTRWNDTRGRTATDVRALLEAAAGTVDTQSRLVGSAASR